MTQSLQDLVREVYIKPIRSALIIDDDYPTWEEILASEDTRTTYSRKNWTKNRAQIRTLIQGLQETGHRRIVDVNDASNIDGSLEDSVSDLFQTDLLVLDFQLDRVARDGALSLQILRKIIENERFNLAIVHTSEDLREAAEEYLIGMLGIANLTDLQADSAKGSEVLEALELDEPDLVGTILSYLSRSLYIKLRKSPASMFREACKGTGALSRFKSLMEKAKIDPTQRRNVLAKCVREFERQHEVEGVSLPDLSWSLDAKPIWLRTPTAFIAFAKKVTGDSESPSVIDILVDALTNWAPRPSRLLVAKIRTEIEARGTIVEDLALGDSLVLAQWYKDLFSTPEKERAFKISNMLDRHGEQLLEQVRTPIIEFGKSIIGNGVATIAEQPDGVDGIIKDLYDVDLANTDIAKSAELRHNVFVCSRKPTGLHLTTGHVLKIDNDYWVCLSPACDLVPDQRTNGIYASVDGFMPFMAINLQPTSHQSALEDVNSNRYIFIDDEDSGAPVALCYNLGGKTNSGSAPAWSALLAGDDGRIKAGNKLHIFSPHLEAGNPKFIKSEAVICAQLRYAYALNLMSKFGHHMNRVGLDFSGR